MAFDFVHPAPVHHGDRPSHNNNDKVFNCTGDLESTLNHCCNTGKTWSVEKKSCNITLSFPLFNVNVEHNTMCLTTVGACCLQSLRYVYYSVMGNVILYCYCKTSAFELFYLLLFHYFR